MLDGILWLTGLPIQSSTLEVQPLTLNYAQSSYNDSGFQRVRLKHKLKFEGWNSHVLRELPGRSESTNLTREPLSLVGRLGVRPISLLTLSLLTLQPLILRLRLSQAP